MRKMYTKLVRDKIPEIIQRNGHTCEHRTISDEEEYRRALRDKLQEEAHEAAEATADTLIVELADLYEVMDALMATYGISQEKVRTQQEYRRGIRGGFEQRIQLLWVD